MSDFFEGFMWGMLAGKNSGNNNSPSENTSPEGVFGLFCIICFPLIIFCFPVTAIILAVFQKFVCAILSKFISLLMAVNNTDGGIFNLEILYNKILPHNYHTYNDGQLYNTYGYTIGTIITLIASIFCIKFDIKIASQNKYYWWIRHTWRLFAFTFAVSIYLHKSSFISSNQVTKLGIITIIIFASVAINFFYLLTNHCYGNISSTKTIVHNSWKTILATSTLGIIIGTSVVVISKLHLVPTGYHRLLSHARVRRTGAILYSFDRTTGIRVVRYCRYGEKLFLLNAPPLGGGMLVPVSLETRDSKSMNYYTGVIYYISRNCLQF